jgi:hypothetical protein
VDKDLDGHGQTRNCVQVEDSLYHSAAKTPNAFLECYLVVVSSRNALMPSLDPADLDALGRAVKLLENPGLAARLANYAGVPLEALFKRLPASAGNAVRQSVSVALERCLDMALYRIDGGFRFLRSTRMSKVAVAASGAAAGAFGIAALAAELPVTTALMLRSIAQIARAEGEDVTSPEGRVNCLEVLALGGHAGEDDQAEIGYFAVRAALAQEVTAAIRFLNTASARESAPVLIRLLESIGARFGIVVSEKAAAGAIPAIGALGSATVNVLFMDHFQGMAKGHFAIRRLERKYGAEVVKYHYSRLLERAGKN